MKFRHVATTTVPDQATGIPVILLTAVMDDGTCWQRWAGDPTWMPVDPPVSKPPVTPGETKVQPLRRRR